MCVAPWANVAVLALLVGSCLVAHHSAWGEEPGIPSRDITFTIDPLNGEPPREVDFTEFFAALQKAPDPDIKMVTYGLDIIDDQVLTPDTAKRTYRLVCRERLLELERNPGPLVEFTFDINGDTEAVPQPNPVRQALGSFLNSVRKKPAASELIAGKIDDAILQARVDEQIKGFDLYMEVENGRVILEGDVVSVEQQRRVKKIVKSIPEVRRLVYRVTVRQPEM